MAERIPTRTLGADGPGRSGVQPLGILRTVAMLSSLGDVPADVAFCFCAGSTARMRALDAELIEVVVDGAPRVGRSRNTPPADKMPEVLA